MKTLNITNQNASIVKRKIFTKEEKKAIKKLLKDKKRLEWEKNGNWICW